MAGNDDAVMETAGKGGLSMGKGKLTMPEKPVTIPPEESEKFAIKFEQMPRVEFSNEPKKCPVCRVVKKVVKFVDCNEESVTVCMKCVFESLFKAAKNLVKKKEV